VQMLSSTCFYADVVASVVLFCIVCVCVISFQKYIINEYELERKKSINIWLESNLKLPSLVTCGFLITKERLHDHHNTLFIDEFWTLRNIIMR
jgi:hypothetical protein